ncbi:hypothetical protein GRI40_08975 [Altererythrobacter aerius]|uniref:Uncharacterized protein n=1 Tax=Tsuneonella aeria TaxID=1837929 RepID=A0A6I4TF36_9SPHN|nr:hypothetical protein [Tsuneonella aeria]MXO75344.1 hypothetical protein [Tsuneonella aeria]
MDPVLRTSLIVFAAVLLKSVILGWWERFRTEKANQPIRMRLRAGRYVAWGPVQKVQHYGWRLTQLWLVYIAVLLALLTYTKLIGPIF